MSIDDMMRMLTRNEICVWLRNAEEADEFMEICDGYNMTWGNGRRPTAGYPSSLYSSFNIKGDNGVVMYGGYSGRGIGWNRRKDHTTDNGYSQAVIAFRDVVPEVALAVGCVDEILSGG